MVIRFSRHNLPHRGRYGKDRICPKCKKVIERDAPIVGKYHNKCYNSLLIDD